MGTEKKGQGIMVATGSEDGGNSDRPPAEKGAQDKPAGKGGGKDMTGGKK